jgi:hypothetical protein
VSVRGVAVFADYQLLAAMGKLTEYLKAPQPDEAEPLNAGPLGIYPTKLPPVLWRAPGPGPEPLSTFEPMPKTVSTWPIPVPAKPKVAVSDIKELWPQYTADAGTQAPKHAQTAPNGEGHFPFATATADEANWPTTSLSFAPTAAGMPGLFPKTKN